MITNVDVAAGTHKAIVGVLLALALSGCARMPAKGQAASTPPPARPVVGAQQPPPAGQAAPKPAPKPRVAVSADGTKIAYDVNGTGPALMLLHGGGQTRTSWADRGYVERLSKRFTVITPDRRGTGDSEKPTTAGAYALDQVLADLLAVADAAGAKRFHVLGYGHGGSLARYLAARSDRVISAVLIETPMGSAVTGMVKDALVAMRAKWQPLLDAKRAGTLDLKTLSREDRVVLDGETPISALALGAMVDYPSLQPAEIKAPTLWIVGSGDASAMENVKEYEGKLSGTNVTLKVLSGATYPDCFLRINDILAEVEPFLAKTGSS